jgi:hypothetical protein
MLMDGKMEQGIGTVRAAGGNPFGAGRFNSRRDQALLLITKQAILSSMGIQGKNRKAWPGQGKLML